MIGLHIEVFFSQTHLVTLLKSLPDCKNVEEKEIRFLKIHIAASSWRTEQNFF
jgi:hypothetical protein